MTTTTVLSRRALFSTSAAALAASAVPVAPAALASIPAIMPAVPEVDARLWELARALGPAEEAWSDAYMALDEVKLAYRKQVPKRPQPFEGEAAKEWQAIADEVAGRVGYYEAEELYEETLEHARAVHADLREIAATTLAGLRAKAQAVKVLVYSEDFEEYVEEYYESNGKSPESMALIVVRDLLRMAAAPKS